VKFEVPLMLVAEVIVRFTVMVRDEQLGSVLGPE
jgi:hypothetical protein